MNISKRLKAIAKYTDGFKSLADIACDHGYLGIYAAEHYGLKKVLLTDINPMPLASAVKNCKSRNLEDVICCKLGDGLNPLTEDYEVISISGIGGILMKDILSEGIDRIKSAKRLILCPNTDLYEVRKFLSDNMFVIEFEEIIHEHKYYEIIVAKYVGQPQNYLEIELKYGPHLIKSKSDEFISNYKLQLEMLNKQIVLINDINAKEKISLKINEISKILGNNL